MAGEADQTVEIWADGEPVGAANPLPTSASGGGGGAVTIADGADVALGATSASESASGNGTAVGLLKNLRTRVASVVTLLNGGLPAALGANGGLKVEGVASGVAQPVSAASLPLPSGAATAAKQPALGTAGAASADVITVQGAASGTALAVDPSAAKRGTLTDRSTTVTAGGTAQQLMATNSSRKYLFIRNPITATERLWINFTTTAVADSPSIALDPGDAFVMESGFVSTEAISVLGATTGHKITAKEG